ncbi:four helix bundle protein [Flavobacterium selenitireducens]|uniref:four helix bundle protein n=1 Tax=Flavobacterium selenitireducens TaxID=2722704 RepID=UPI00168BFCA5|nr:four helix bundle protein [Flavobacterium selenitireducens]
MEYVKLEVWVQARRLANRIYEITDGFPKVELYGLSNQMRRCAVSIPSNIAEGCGRQTSKDTINFLHISRGSLYELETQTYLSFDRKYISEEELDDVLLQILDCKKLLNGFINYYRKL